MNQEIKKIIVELLNCAGITFSDVVTSDDNGLCFMIESADSSMLIGKNGENLTSLSYIVNRVASKRFPDLKDRIEVDVGGYLRNIKENLKTKAKILGERARSLKANVELPPMHSYERMIIHSFFEGASDIKTESVGFGDSRRVVIKYVGA